MEFCSLNGKLESVKNSYLYLIDWEGKSLSKFQQKVKNILSPFWEKDIVFEEFPMVNSRLTFDFYNASRRIILEVDGHQHYQYSSFYHKNKGDFYKQIVRDQTKQEFCDLNNLSLIRIYESDKLNNKLLKKLKLI